MGMGVIELGIFALAALFSLLPIVVAVWAIVMIVRLRGQVDDLQQRLDALDAE